MVKPPLNSGMMELDALFDEIRACRICVDQPIRAPLPHAPRPVIRGAATARILIAGQAPGTRVHASGKPFTDPSGDRLRDWMGVDEATFYDETRIAIVPMGFCFPGLDAKGGDLPPRRECAPAWRDAVMAALPAVELILAVGLSAMQWHLGSRAKSGMTATVADWRAILADTAAPSILPLPHPSWRNSGWIKRNPWFEADLLPVLQRRVAEHLRSAD
ncbi:uracil-DNA glycosylase family protein [Kaistia sp. 32K]|uniref:uracil-DNA glycosylase family protein n=1 Tax=Kaistia sp. 32K TaxID=2795690 RepID=UPI001FD5BDA4|nr:uracil-DNA glycosylase family protein [Kaistia sp. 32K]